MADKKKVEEKVEEKVEVKEEKGKKGKTTGEEKEGKTKRSRPKRTEVEPDEEEVTYYRIR